MFTLLCCFQGLAFAGPTINGSSGLFTVYNADTLYKGNFSFALYYNNIDRDPLDWDITFWHLSLSYGLTSRLEISCMIPFVQREGDPTKNYPELGSFFRDGFGDTVISAKYDLVRERDFPVDVALRGYIGLPSGEEDDGLGRGKVFFGGDFILSKVLGSVGTHINIGGNVSQEPDPVMLGVPMTASDEFTWGFGLNFPYESNIQGIFELTGIYYFDDDDDQDDPVDITVGFRYKTMHGLQVGAGFKANVAMDSDSSEQPYGAIVEVAYYEPDPTPTPEPIIEPRQEINHPPRVKIFAPETVTGCENPDIRAKGSDSDGDILTYSWNWSHGEIIGSGPFVQWKSPCCDPVIATISVTVDDGNGATGSDTVQITVICPPPAPEVVVFDPVHFDFDSARLTNIAKAILDDVALSLKRDPRLEVSIEGHTCTIGPSEYNIKLGMRRANAVYKYLVDRHGISPDRLSVKSFGEDRPIAPNDTLEGRKMNRRVELIVPY
jgi:outer membrane protein OmpA-like peptidoglycan-associated protein